MESSEDLLQDSDTHPMNVPGAEGKSSLPLLCWTWVCHVPIAFVWTARSLANSSISVGTRGLIARNPIAILIPSWIARILSVRLQYTHELKIHAIHAMFSLLCINLNKYESAR